MLVKQRAGRPDDLGDLRLLSRLAAHCDAADLRGHFVLGMPPPVEPSGWETRSFGPWTIAVEARLPIHDARDETGAQIGWLLGHAFDLAAAGPTDRVVLSRRPTDGDDPRPAVQRWIESHAGRFVLLLLDWSIVASESLASVPVVFDRERNIVASSPFLLQSFDDPIPDDELADVVRINETGLWFLFGATPHARAERLLPNHILDLRSWQQERQWPTGPLGRAPEPELIEQIAWTIERTIVAAAAGSELNQSLTAGGDTRVMLACSRSVLDRIHFFTVAQPDLVGRADSMLASRLASRFALDHQVLRWRRHTLDDQRRFMIRTGALAGEARGSRAGPTYALLGDERPYVSGIHERASLGWRPGDGPETRLDGAELLRRYSTPLHPRLVAAASDWLANLPGLDTVDALTLFGTEMRLGSWGGALTTAYPDAYTYTLYPFAHRSVLGAEMQMDLERRRFGAYREDLIRTRWPELLDFGINAEPARVRAAREARRAHDSVRATLGEARRRLRRATRSRS